MTRYGGTKALDAEMKIDLIKKTILLDYSDYSTVGVLSSEWEKTTHRVKQKYLLWVLAISFMRFFGIFGMYIMYFTILVNLGIIRSADAHFDHQNLLKYVYTFIYGTIEKTTSGELKESQLVVYLPANVYFEYVLEGEYKEKIQSVSLVRNYGTWKKFGVFKEVRQYGWNLIFDFIDPPKSGSCTVEFVC